MELSVLVAQIFGLVYVMFGLGMLINGSYYKKALDEMMNNSGFMVFGGMISLVIGFLLVRSHNVWVGDWTVLVTILGWLALVKGVLLLLAPNFLVDISKSILKNTQVVGVGALILGLILGYFGFYA
jgi:uncharacterized protein YjeT (DUF2065 family)